MLTFRETDLLVAAELDENTQIVKEIYYTEPNDKPTDKHDEKTGKYNCGYCGKQLGRKDTLINHKKLCLVRIMTEKFETRNFKEYETKQENHRLELMMPYNKERGLRMYISGPPRCGKSYLIGQTIKEYVRHNPKRKIYLFSQVDNDRAIDDTIDLLSETTKWKSDNFIRIDLEKFKETDIEMDEFRGKINKRTGKRYGSLCIFDDIDKIPDNALQKKIDKLKDAILATGRDHEYRGGDIDLIVSNHSSLGYKRTQELLNQATYLVLFPKGTSDHHIRTVCMKYCGLVKEQVEKIIHTESRYVIIHREMPLFVLEEKKIWLIK